MTIIKQAPNPWTVEKRIANSGGRTDGIDGIDGIDGTDKLMGLFVLTGLT